MERNGKVAIVAALEREVRPLVRHWHTRHRESGGREFRFFENGEVVVVCGGIGNEAARRAAEAVIALYAPAAIYSAGFAGALTDQLKIADVLQPGCVVNAADGSSMSFEGGEGVLVTFGTIASPEQKKNLRVAYAAQAVDMEAAGVARAAEARGVRCGVIKAISDECDFVFPEMEHFVDAGGQFSEWKLGVFATMRPWLWPRVLQLMRNSRRASRVLCERLSKINIDGTAQARRW
jgi:adenosylhomocysteine nucleosidase